MIGTRNYLPWIPQELQKMIGTRNYLLTKAKKSGNEENWAHYRKMRNHVVNVLRGAKLSYFEQVTYCQQFQRYLRG